MSFCFTTFPHLSGPFRCLSRAVSGNRATDPSKGIKKIKGITVSHIPPVRIIDISTVSPADNGTPLPHPKPSRAELWMHLEMLGLSDALNQQPLE